MRDDENESGGAALGTPLPTATAVTAEHEVQVTTRVLPSGIEAKFKLPENVALVEVLVEGARRAGVQLLPPAPQRTLDLLHNILKHDVVGPAIADLDQPLGPYLKQKVTSHDFGIELVLAFRVNTRWAVATKPQMTPREILALPSINLDPAQYTLYPADSANLLPIDTPVSMTRGQAFEAQRDGKYGA